MGAQGGSALGLKAWNQTSGQDFSEGLRRGGSGALSREAQRPRALPAGIACGHRHAPKWDCITFFSMGPVPQSGIKNEKPTNRDKGCL